MHLDLKLKTNQKQTFQHKHAQHSKLNRN